MKKLTVMLITAFLATGCQTNNSKAEPAIQLKDEEIIATVNGKPISQTALQIIAAEAKQRNKDANIPRKQLIDELVKRELLAQEAEQKELSKDQAIALNLYIMKRVVLSQAAAQDYLKHNDVTEAEAKAEYDRRVAEQANNMEYKARHILTKTEDEAKKIIADLEKGAPFADQAKKFSIDPGASNGGDLGWFSANRMVKPFSDAVIALQNGEFTKTPVQTQFGWHVILREDSRTAAVPAYEDVKDQLKVLMQRLKLQAHLEELEKKAAVVIKEEGAGETPATP